MGGAGWRRSVCNKKKRNVDAISVRGDRKREVDDRCFANNNREREKVLSCRLQSG